MGVDVTMCGPPTLLPKHRGTLPGKWTTDLEEAIAEADVVYALRIQRERQEHGLFPSIREYISLYGITPERLANLRSGAVIMHPGPVNRGWELSEEAVDADNSLILKQVTNGIAIRMAVLYLTAGRDLGSIQVGRSEMAAGEPVS
jgi:aspartate carbamoyltransferase catalytic subunit